MLASPNNLCSPEETVLCPFVCYRLFITGPVSHYFYQLMEALIPSADPHCIIKRLLLDRLIFAPGFLLIFYFVMNILEVRTSQNDGSQMCRYAHVSHVVIHFSSKDGKSLKRS